MSYDTLHYDKVLAATERAMLFEIGDREVWIPKSLIDDERLNESWNVVGSEYGAYPMDEGPGETDVKCWFLENEELL